MGLRNYDILGVTYVGIAGRPYFGGVAEVWLGGWSGYMLHAWVFGPSGILGGSWDLLSIVKRPT